MGISLYSQVYTQGFGAKYIFYAGLYVDGF